MQMQNPSQGLAAPLQNHVHLISSHRFPLIASLNIDQALTYLLDAPMIVKGVAPMSWQYQQGPQDGMLWLEWLAPDRTDGRFPSDGYIWADPEATYRHEHRGYTIEMMRHTVGYRPGLDHMASHARTRYHIIAKNPSVNAAQPEPALWIVHYHHADQGRILPSNNVPFTPQMQQVMNERRWLEGQGKLVQRDFMLHDRGSWPMISVPSGSNPMQARQLQYGTGVQQRPPYPAYYNQQPPGQAPPAKRQRTNPPAPGTSDGVHDTSIEDEENTTLGDFFDHLTPRDISMTRYMQHHRWMEEVFSSPYASNQIVPPDLGLGLMGELKGLTDGILEPPSLDFAGTDKPAPKAKEAQPFTNLSKEQIDEFNKRVTKHLEDGQAEIEKMKEEHAKKMQEWKKTTTLTQAEKRLRYATWEGHEDAVPAFRLEETAANGHADEGAQKETVDDVVKDVEKLLGAKISGHKEASMVEKGGMEKESTPAPPAQPQPQQSTMIQQQASMIGQQQRQPPSPNTTEPTIYHGDPMHTGTHQQQYPQAQQAEQQAQTMAQSAQQQDTSGQQSTIDDSGMNDDTSMIEGMDVDVNDSNVDFGDSQFDVAAAGNSAAAAPSAETPLQAPSDQNSGATSGVTPQMQTTSTPAFGESAGQQAPAQPQQEPATTEPGATAGESNIGQGAMAGSTGMAGEGGVDDMFNNNTFGDLTNMGDTGGEDFLDFESGGMGMDDSAFGEAMHGMGTPGPGGEAGGQEGGS